MRTDDTIQVGEWFGAMAAWHHVAISISCTDLHVDLVESHALGHVVLHGEHQRSRAVVRLAVDRGAELKEILHDVEVSKSGGEHHRRHAIVVRMVDLDVDIRLDHELDHVGAVD